MIAGNVVTKQSMRETDARFYSGAPRGGSARQFSRVASVSDHSRVARFAALLATLCLVLVWMTQASFGADTDWVVSDVTGSATITDASGAAIEPAPDVSPASRRAHQDRRQRPSRLATRQKLSVGKTQKRR